MKRRFIFILGLATLMTLGGCVKASNTTKRKSNTSMNGSVGNGFTNDGTNSNSGNSGSSSGSGTNNNYDNSSSSVTGCKDGIERPHATRCYYTLPTLTFSGSGEPGAAQYWSSAYHLGNTYSTNIFRTDMNFAVRVRPRMAQDPLSFQGRTCSKWTKNNFQNMQVRLMLSKSSDNGLSNNIKTFTAKLNEFSETVRYDVPYGSTGPLVLSVYSVLTDHRCDPIYGKLSAHEQASCKAGQQFYDIPVNQGLSNPTECVSFEIQFATDYTYDLPD